MRARPGGKLAWVPWLLTWVLVGLTVGVALASSDALTDQLGDLLPLVVLFVPATIGALIAYHRPRHVIGWLLGVLSLVLAASILLNTVFQRLPPADPARVRWVAWTVNVLVEALLLAMLGYLVLFFPTGRLLSPRWRPLAGLLLLLLGGQVLHTALGTDLSWESPDIRNPARITTVVHIADTIAPVVTVLLLASLVGAFASFILRFRRARGIERQQLKWFGAWLSAISGCLLAAFIVTVPLGMTDSPLGHAFTFLSDVVGLVIGMPIVLGITILRYRLYEIDVLIRRTMVYGALTLSLGTLYVLVVLLPTVVLGKEGVFADPLIAGATLLAAALFRPLRARIQQVVDRRFNRAHYNATHTIAAFSQRLRDEVDLATLTRELEVVVIETMQPTHVSLWLGPTARRAP